MITLPASKSIGARFLVASYFAGSLSSSPRFNDCDDLMVIQQALNNLENHSTTILDIHASGTAFRFMAAVAASTPGADITLTGTSRLCSRPMTPLLGVLRQAGASIEALGNGDTGPFHISGTNLRGGEYEIRGDVSSQFISAIMLVAPTWENGLSLRFSTPLVSRPYAEMTAQVMRRFGIKVELTDRGVSVESGKYIAPEDFSVEADWSAAGFFYEACSFRDAPLEIADLASPSESLQGDSATARLFEGMGVESIFNKRHAIIQRRFDLPGILEADLSHNPDLAPAFAVACALNSCHFRFTGVRNLRLKECDRLEAISNELGKLGYNISVGDDHIEWNGDMSDRQNPAVIETYDDHRIAMAFAMAALRTGEIRIANPDVVEKSFADFWNQLPKLGLNCHRDGEIMTVTDSTSNSCRI